MVYTQLSQRCKGYVPYILYPVRVITSYHIIMIILLRSWQMSLYSTHTTHHHTEPMCCLMLGQRCRRFASNKTTLFFRLVSVGVIECTWYMAIHAVSGCVITSYQMYILVLV